MCSDLLWQEIWPCVMEIDKSCNEAEEEWQIKEHLGYIHKYSYPPSPFYMETQIHGYLYFVKVLHLFPVCQPRLHVGGSLDDESLVVCKHLREAVGKNLAELHVQFVVPQLQLLT